MASEYNVPQVPEEVKNEDEFGVAVTVNDQKPEELHGLPTSEEEGDPALWPRIRLKRLELVNFGKYEDAVIDFTHDSQILPMVCLVGPNGTGKTTILDAVTMLCSDFSEYTPERFADMMLRRVRNWMHLQGDDRIRNASFSVKGIFEATYPVFAPPYIEGLPPAGNSTGQPIVQEYAVEFTRHKFRSRHPKFIEKHLYRYCFVARFDAELTNFQMRRERWPLFQELFSSVTGFPIEEDTSNLFYDTADTRMRRIYEAYVLQFLVRKPREIIRQNMCSSGEKKIAKCFSTVLNATIQPSIIVVDNVLMHIEVGRHLAVMECLQRCFPSSQLVVACHSVPVSKSLPSRERLFDMRWLDIPGLVWREPWRLRLMDDVNESLERIVNRQTTQESSMFVSKGASLLRRLETDKDSSRVMVDVIDWMGRFPSFLVGDMLDTPAPKMRWHDNRQSH